MTHQIAEYFNRFYCSVLKERLNDPLLHSEWIYFMSMFKSEVEKQRVELYLNMLTNEKKKRDEHKNTPLSHTAANQHSKQKTETARPAVLEDIRLPSDIKMEKRHSEKWRANLSCDQNMPEYFQGIRKTSDLNQAVRPLKTIHQDQSMQSKSSKSKQQEQTYAMPTCDTFYPFYTLHSPTPDSKQTKERKDRERHSKLKQISHRVLKAMGQGKICA